MMKQQSPHANDWTKASTAVKITAMVMWVVIPFGFLIVLYLNWNAHERLEAAIENDAQILLNSSRVLLSDNNAYNDPQVTETLEAQLATSVYCQLTLEAHSADEIILSREGCIPPSSALITKTYYFSALFAQQPEEVKMSLYRQSIASMLAKERAKNILQVIVIVFFSGLILSWAIRLLVLKPLLKIVDKTRLIADGNHDLRISTGQQDELGYLGRFLNQMLDNLFEQQKNFKQTNLKLMKEIAQRNRIALELRTHRDQLEQLIRERTIDLAVARDEALEANRAKSLFLANISQEIRTPMNVILGYSQLLKRGGSLDARQHKSIEIIEQSGSRLLELLNDILDISRIETGKMTLNKVNFDLNELTHSVSNLFSERCTEKDLEWVCSNDLSGQVLVESDPRKLRQILINLLSNAVKFTDKGSIKFTISVLQDNLYYFEIADTGPGISAENQEHIFEAFEKISRDKNTGGSGLGLTITRKQLELLGSELKLSSGVNTGSVFSFVIHLESARVGFEIRKDKETELIQMAQHRDVNFLVVDDVELSRLLLSDMLSETTASVKAVKNGLEAIEFIHDSAENNKPDIVFMDIHMPVMNGLDAMRKIKQQYGDQIICVALTSTFMETSESDLIAAGFDDYISRPYRFEEVFDCLQRHLRVDLENVQQLQLDIDHDVKLEKKNLSIDLTLCKKIISASQRYALNEIKHYLLQLETRGAEEKQLARNITRLMSLYDMEGIEKLLTHVCAVNTVTEKMNHD